MAWQIDDVPTSSTPTILSPTTCNQAVAARMRDLRGLSVRGEVSAPRQSGGHLYFELKDANSRIRAVIWRSTLQRLRLDLRGGEDVICHGDLDLWVQGGTYSLVVSRIERGGMGVQWEAFQRLKSALDAEGLFDVARKRRLPFLPTTVGIVTALGGAGLRDILRVLHDRYPVVVIIAPSRVQGVGAGAEVATALSRLDRSGLCDVIIVGRGGGSIEDLWAFNEEPVARAIAACSVPVVSAVGHETDTLLSDYVADVRAPTPTAAAELVVPRLEDLQGRLEELIARMIRRTGRAITVRRRELLLLRQRLSGDRLTAERRASVDRLRARVHQLGQRRLASERRQCSALALRLGRADPRRRLASGRQRLERLQARLKAVALRVDALRRQRLLRALERLRFAGAIAHQLAPRAARLDRLVVALRALDPNAALRRGYAIVRDLDSGAAIRDARAVAPRQRLEVTLASGSLGVDVVTVHAPATDASSGGPR